MHINDQETYGKSGVRRAVPGHYLAADPKGRAIMIGALERQKLVYQMNRDPEARLTISSPLEAHKQFTLCYGVVGIDVGFENPLFACLEYDYEVFFFKFVRISILRNWIMILLERPSRVLIKCSLFMSSIWDSIMLSENTPNPCQSQETFSLPVFY